jgi:selenide,water dikinase
MKNGLPPIRKEFNPEEYGLNKEFLLTNFSDLKGWGCKLPQSKLQSYLKNIGKGDIATAESADVSILDIRNTNKSKTLISTIDFFYPLVEDPYL